MKIYEDETDFFVKTVSEVLMNYALYNLVPQVFGTNESGFNLWAAELMQIMESRQSTLPPSVG